MALIKKIDINASNIRSNASGLPIGIFGDSDAVFSLQVKRSNGDFYDFTTNLFTSTNTSRNRLANQTVNGGYSTNVAIPAAASGDTYTVLVYAEPHFNTSLFEEGRVLYTTTITQVADSTITFSIPGFASVETTSIGTSVGSPTDSFTSAGSPTVVMNKLRPTPIVSVANFGMFIGTFGNNENNGTFNGGHFYWLTDATTYQTVGSGSASTSLVLNTVDNLYIGMDLNTIVSSTLTGEPKITAIDTATKTLTISVAQTWADAKFVDFRSYGSNLIKKSTNIGLNFKDLTISLDQVTTTVRTAIASGTATSIDVNGTAGISSGANARCKFLNKASSSSAFQINDVVGSIAAGSFNILNGEFDATVNPINIKTIIYIDGSSDQVELNGTISISKYPVADETIYLDLSKFIVAGAASS